MKTLQTSSLLVLGMLSLTAAILLHRYVNSDSTVDFIEGLLFGISIALNLLYLIRMRRSNKE